MDFQTPKSICEYMTSFLPEKADRILEPTKGEGNLVRELEKKGTVVAPEDFFSLDFKQESFEWIVMNPPFTPMKLGYEILYKCMDMTDNIIALMPWLTMINSQKRTKLIMDYGLKSITTLPRSVFQGSRVQTCILQMHRGYSGVTEFKTLDFNGGN